MDSSLVQKRVLVTGASGFIGSRLVSRLLEGGAQVRAFVRSPAKAAHLAKMGAEVCTGDMTDPTSLKEAVSGQKIVFHLAGLLTEWEPISYYRKVNVDGVKTLAEAALEAGVERFIHTSSIAVYGLKTSGQVDEHSPHYPSRVNYADTKIAGEEVIKTLFREQGLPAVIVQPAEVYGPRDTHWTMRPIEMCKSGSMILIDGGKGLVQPIYIDDLVEGLLAAACKGRLGEAYILAGPDAVTLHQFFGYYARLAGRKKLPSVPGWLAHALAFSSESLAFITRRPPFITRMDVLFNCGRITFNISKAERELGFCAHITLEEGMRYVEEWLNTASAM